MARRPKPRVHQGWYVTEAGGSYTKLCRVEEGVDRARVLLDNLVHGDADGREKSSRPLSVAEAVGLFMAHARTYYRLPTGAPSEEVGKFEDSFRELLAGWGTVPARLVDRRTLKAVRERMVAAGLSRGVVNQRVGRVVRAFRWLAEEEHVPDVVAASLTLLRPLQAHRSAAPETAPVEPVDAARVVATLRHLAEPWRSMVALQWFTGMRPGEVVRLKVSMLHPVGPAALVADFGVEHKMAYRGGRRRVAIGASGYMVVRPWLYNALVAGRDAVFVSLRTGKPIRAVTSYDHAVEKAARAAGVEHWHPNQIRHAVATRVRGRYGLEAAGAVLGHDKMSATEVYAERDRQLAVRVAEEMG